MTIKDIIDTYGVTLTDISKRFGIPYRTLQHWNKGDRETPEYVLNMMAEVYRLERR